jgi:23S rRNA (cytidine1920-2'-O)/16S rRNA (cytidine1409-2'-O)-methyltransferase
MYNTCMRKVRLDELLIERGLAESREQAQRLVMAGRVRVGGQVALKAGGSLSPESSLEVVPGPLYVSRGGEKLAAALRAFDLDVTGRVCADVGASSGGFTDCLLQNGASRVYAIDVGVGILEWKLRQDERVVVMEGTNARYLKHLPEPVSLVAIDVSFISLKIILPTVQGWLQVTPLPPVIEKSKGEILALVKPQFEAGRKEVQRGKGVIRDVEVHQQVLYDLLSFAQGAGYGVQGLIRSPLLGPKGNVEFLAWLGFPCTEQVDIGEAIATVRGGQGEAL